MLHKKRDEVCEESSVAWPYAKHQGGSTDKHKQLLRIIRNKLAASASRGQQKSRPQWGGFKHLGVATRYLTRVLQQIIRNVHIVVDGLHVLEFIEFLHQVEHLASRVLIGHRHGNIRKVRQLR